MPVESSNQQTVNGFQASLAILVTYRRLVLFLAKQIPCSRLDEDNKNAKYAPKTGRCSYCDIGGGPENEVEKVCKPADFCSKECCAK